MSNYPLLNYHFQVNWGGTRSEFTEVIGLSIEHSVIEYREGTTLDEGITKMPGLKKSGNIILRRGIVHGDNEFFQWINTIENNEVERRDVTISLLNEDHEPVMIWKLEKAWPVKLDSPILRSAANEVAIESLEITHEGITIETP